MTPLGSRMYGAFTLVWGLVMLLLWISGVCRWCLHLPKLRCAATGMRKWCRERCVPWGSSKLDPPLQAEVESRMNDLRSQRVHGVMQVLVVLSPFGAANNVFAGMAMLQADSMYVLEERVHYVFIILLEVLGILFYFKPRCINTCTLRLGFSSLMAASLALAFMMAVFDTHEKARDGLGGLPGGFPTYVLVNHFLRMSFGLLVQDAQFVLVATGVAVPLTSAIHVISGQPQWAMVEVLLSGISYAATLSFHLTTKRAICATLNAETSKAFEVATETLLSSICDAVVHLSCSFDLTNDCPRLSALLLRPLSCTTSNFCDLIYNEEDKEALEAFLGSSASSGGEMLASTMHTTLRDAHGIPVHVQLFHTSCAGGTSAATHIVGVRDVGGERYAPLVGAVNGVIQDASQDMTSRNGGSRSALSAINELCPSLGTDSSYGGDSSTDVVESRLEISADQDDASVWISALDSTLPMIKWTPAFLCLLGPSALSSASSLLDFVPQEDQEGVLTRMQAITNSLAYEDGEEIAELYLTISTTPHGKVELYAQVLMDVDSDGDPNKFIVILKVVSWRRSRHRKAKSRKGELKQKSAALSGEVGDRDFTAPPDLRGGVFPIQL